MSDLVLSTGDTRIRPATLEDAAFLPAIEQSAGELFRSDPDLAWLADGENLSVERFRALIEGGWSWVATAAEHPVGFVAAAREGEEIHIWELDVIESWQRKGLGRALLDALITRARGRGVPAVTLTTFSDLAWNAPFYQSMGFSIVPASALSDRLKAQLEAEAAGGLPMERRCAMRLALG